jgi:hypothetical protein
VTRPVEWDEQHNLRWKVAVPGHGASSPVVWGNRLFVTTAVPVDSARVDTAGGNPMLATDGLVSYRLLAFDTATGALAWSRTAVDGQIYVVKDDKGVLYCLEASTGQILYGPERLPGLRGVYASPVAADGRVYFAGRHGAVAVVTAGPTFERLAVNRLAGPGGRYDLPARRAIPLRCGVVALACGHCAPAPARMSEISLWPSFSASCRGLSS